MASNTLPASAAVPSVRVAIPLWVIAALAGFSLALFVPQVLDDGDTYSHIATGLWMLGHGAVPHTDPFSYTFAGQPWTAHEWLAELIMGMAFKAGGWNAIVLLYGAATALTLALMARHLCRWLPLAPAAIALILGAACVGPSLLARPHILALPVVVAWVLALLAARESNRVPWRILPLMVLWANLHGSFVFGILLIGPFALEATVAAGRAWRPEAVRWALFGLVTLGMALLTPHFVEGLIFPFKLMHMKQLQTIQEWSAPNFQDLQQIELALMATLLVCFVRGVRIPVFRALLLMGLLHLALQHARHQMLAGVIGALVLAEPLARSFATTPVRLPWRTGLAPLLLGVTLLTGLRIANPVVRTDGESSPISAIDHVPAALAAQPVLNEYGYGGYLIFKGIRPFIDGRADMFGDQFLLDYRKAVRPDGPALTRLFAERNIQWTLFSTDAPAIPMLDAMPGWHRLYADSTAVIHVRDATPPAPTP